jgi:hypothetical protein
VGFLKTTLLHFHKHSLHMIFPFENPKHLHTKAKEGVLSESSHSSAGGLWLSGVVFLLCPSTEGVMIAFGFDEPFHDLL